jgi:hypothetical protein
MSKKILLIIGILAVVGVAFFLIFYSNPQSGESGTPGFSIRNFLPFGGSGNSEANNGTANEESANNETSTSTPSGEPIPRLRKLSQEPVAGSVIWNSGTTSIVRFVEKGTGNVYEARSDSNLVSRLTNTTIPKIIRALWLPNGGGFLAQTLLLENEVIETNFVKLNKNSVNSSTEDLTPFSTTIGKLPTGIREITIKPDGSKIFYYIVNNSSSDWFISNSDGTGATKVYSSPLTEWMPKWVSANSIDMQTKGSYQAVSYDYSFDVQNKALKKIGIALTGISSETNTLPEKCVQSNGKNPVLYCAVPYGLPSSNYPDVWYQGLVKTEDSVKKIDPNSSIASDVYDISSESGEQIDAMNISISPDNTYLIFQNKIDGYLWMLRIGN